MTLSPRASTAACSSAAGDAATALAGTVDAINVAVADRQGTLGKAFAANPSCAALSQ